ncbi:MAG: tRNA pseudouridine(55) synthase TruB [Desulfobacterales bacterium]|nr:tRNA pseudouridine(55) synthase TruB [Desulfobacterales bacterium]
METNGIVVIDKPAGITSAKVVAVVKKLLGAKKVGHTGTLDPFATGVMICCLNQATRLARFFLSGHKTYEAVLRLGIDTDTQDSTGTVTSQCEWIEFSENKIRSVLKQFTGTIQQQPPAFSALKHKGVPLYKLARSGQPVRKAARRVQITAIEIRAIELPEIRFVVSCSAGTYIRTLCADIGAALGCGGHLKTLRRIESSGFSIREAISLPSLEAVSASGNVQDCIIDMAGALRNMPVFVADSGLMDKIRFGKPLTDLDMDPDRIDLSGDFFKVVDSENRLLAVVSLNKKDRAYKYNCVFHS